jgi:hypothetical protein
MSMESHGGMILTGETDELGEKSDPVSLCSQVPSALTRVSEVSLAANYLSHGMALISE